MRDDGVVFIDYVAWTQIEEGLSPDERERLGREGYPTLKAPSGMAWKYLPLTDRAGGSIAVVAGGHEAEKQYYEETRNAQS